MDAQTLSLAMGGSALALSLYNCATAMPRGVYAKGGSPFCASSSRAARLLPGSLTAAVLLLRLVGSATASSSPQPRGPTPSFPTRS